MSSPEVTRIVDELPADALPELLGRAVTRYAELAGERPGLAPFAPETGPSPTAVAVTVSAMLEQAGIEVFELGLWRAWGAGGA